MAQFWMAIFFILLAIAQLYQSIQAIDLPLPLYLVLGVVLAVASNYQQLSVISPQQVKLEEIKTPEPVLPTQPEKLAELKAADPVIPARQIELDEVPASEPVLPAQPTPMLTATEPETAPARVETVTPKKSRPRKTTPKSRSKQV